MKQTTKASRVSSRDGLGGSAKIEGWFFPVWDFPAAEAAEADFNFAQIGGAEGLAAGFSHKKATLPVGRKRTGRYGARLGGDEFRPETWGRSERFERVRGRKRTGQRSRPRHRYSQPSQSKKPKDAQPVRLF
jgi:hypothetical protein